MIADGGSATSIAVLYHDGHREINVGTVVVDPTLTFKTLLMLLSQRIGISSHQFSVYLGTVGTDRKIPINSKVNIAAVSRDGAAHYFFVKRSKRAKKASGKDASRKKTPPEKVMLLRRSDGGEPPYMAAFPAPIIDREEYERRYWNFRMQREAFLMNTSFPFDDEREKRNGGRNVASAAAVCEECLKAEVNGINCDFHLCVHDAVTVGFRTPAGPVSRPAKNSGEDEA